MAGQGKAGRRRGQTNPGEARYGEVWRGDGQTRRGEAEFCKARHGDAVPSRRGAEGVLALGGTMKLDTSYAPIGHMAKQVEFGCGGCAFQNHEKLCHKYSRYCNSKLRPDGCRVVLVKKTIEEVRADWSQLLCTSDAAAILGMTTEQLTNNRRQANAIPFVRVARKTYYERKTIDAYKANGKKQ